MVLVKHLPEESSFVKAGREDHWPEQTHMLAYIADNIAFYRAEFAKSNGANPSNVKPIPRPSETKDKEQQIEAMKRFRAKLYKVKNNTDSEGE